MSTAEKGEKGKRGKGEVENAAHTGSRFPLPLFPSFPFALSVLHRIDDFFDLLLQIEVELAIAGGIFLKQVPRSIGRNWW